MVQRSGQTASSGDRWERKRQHGSTLDDNIRQGRRCWLNPKGASTEPFCRLCEFFVVLLVLLPRVFKVLVIFFLQVVWNERKKAKDKEDAVI